MRCYVRRTRSATNKATKEKAGLKRHYVVCGEADARVLQIVLFLRQHHAASGKHHHAAQDAGAQRQRGEDGQQLGQFAAAEKARLYDEHDRAAGQDQEDLGGVDGRLPGRLSRSLGNSFVGGPACHPEMPGRSFRCAASSPAACSSPVQGHQSRVGIPTDPVGTWRRLAWPDRSVRSSVSERMIWRKSPARPSVETGRGGGLSPDQRFWAMLENADVCDCR